MSERDRKRKEKRSRGRAAMVPILDGSSEHSAHMWSRLDI